MSWVGVTGQEAVAILLTGACIGVVVLAVRTSLVNPLALPLGTSLLAAVLTNAEDALRNLV